jgi:membrane-associated protein
MEFVDFILHINEHLLGFVKDYDQWVYLILFAIIFIETGLIVMPFLPGDSLLFAAGMLAAQGYLNLATLIILLLSAAIIGDTVNYFIGKILGAQFVKLRFRGNQIVKQEYIEKTHLFYEKHGSKTIILARFVPIVRTFAPFVAGIGSMNYRTFITYNIVGGLIWVVGLVGLGYFLGEIPLIKNNFEKVVLGIIFISVIPIVLEVVKSKFKSVN